YSVERIAYSKKRDIFFPFLSAIRYPLSAKRGFTLIELLIVSVIMGVVSLALFGVFNSGIKIWQRMDRSVMNEEVNIFLSKLTRDISNGFQFGAVNFAGGPEEARFATLFYSPQLEKRTVGEVTYAYHQGVLERKERDFSQIYNDREGSFTPILKNLDFCKFIYYAYDKETKDYFWKENWAEERIPLAVRIELGYNDELGTHALSRTVSFPVSK
ncbi:prepilin-type N-terminal cleavage/methylation domain-containing protein, partial [bacterium]